MGFKIFTLCRMTRLFGRFRATVWFSCLCWNKGMVLRRVKTKKRPFYSTAEESSNNIQSYKSTRHVSWTYSYHCCYVVFWQWFMTAGLIYFMLFLHSMCYNWTRSYVSGTGLVPVSRFACFQNDCHYVFWETPEDENPSCPRNVVMC